MPEPVAFAIQAIRRETTREVKTLLLSELAQVQFVLPQPDAYEKGWKDCQKRVEYIFERLIDA